MERQQDTLNSNLWRFCDDDFSVIHDLQAHQIVDVSGLPLAELRFLEWPLAKDETVLDNRVSEGSKSADCTVVHELRRMACKHKST